VVAKRKKNWARLAELAEAISVGGKRSGETSSVSSGTKRSRVRISMRSFQSFFNLPNPSSHTIALGLTRPLTEMSNRNLPGEKRVAGS
jgi:hypothetical protein